MTRAKMIKVCGTVMGAAAVGAYGRKWDSGASVWRNVAVMGVEFVRLCAVSVASIFLVSYIWRQQSGAGGRAVEPGNSAAGGSRPGGSSFRGPAGGGKVAGC